MAFLTVTLMECDDVTPPELVFPPPPLGHRAELFKVAPRVLIDNKGSAEHTLIEVNGRDRRGLQRQSGRRHR